MWSDASVRCSTCRSSSCCPRTARRRIARRSNACFPERRARSLDARRVLDAGRTASRSDRCDTETVMSKLKLNITMSIDGFVAGPNQSPEDPLGIGGEELHGWLVPLMAFRESHGEEGGEINASTPFAEDILGGAGATIMGRNMFGGGPGPWDESWQGWWGDNPPYHHPVFVLTSHPRRPLELQGGTTFHFVTDGIESALEQARAAAGEKNVSLGGGASVAQQYLAAGLLDEIVVSVVPILLGSGARLFANVGDVKLEQVESVAAPGVTHIRYVRV